MFARDESQATLRDAGSNVKAGLETNSVAAQSYTAAQVALVGCLVFGEVPLVGDVLEVALGPGAFLAGAALIAGGLLELGPANLSPFVRQQNNQQQAPRPPDLTSF